VYILFLNIVLRALLFSNIIIKQVSGQVVNIIVLLL
jgi:hypothetical protein